MNECRDKKAGAPPSEWQIDEALKESFPASDPPAHRLDVPNPNDPPRTRADSPDNRAICD